MWLQAFIFQIHTHTHTDTHTQLLLSTAVTPHKQQEQDFIESQCRNRSAAWCSTPFQTSLYSQAGRAAVCCEASRSTHEQRQGKKITLQQKWQKYHISSKRKSTSNPQSSAPGVLSLHRVYGRCFFSYLFGCRTLCTLCTCQISTHFPCQRDVYNRTGR